MRSISFIVLCLLSSVHVEAALAQQDNGIAPAGRVDSTIVGTIGQRQRADDTQGIEPMARIANRVANRVQSRIRNRIDRYYSPQANATSPFEAAGEQARTAGRLRR